MKWVICISCEGGWGVFVLFYGILDIMKFVCILVCLGEKVDLLFMVEGRNIVLLIIFYNLFIVIGI